MDNENPVPLVPSDVTFPPIVIPPTTPHPMPEVRCTHTRMVPPESLTPHPKNPNEHGPDQLAVYKSIIEFQGWRKAIKVSKQTGLITAGHGAREVALMAGWPLVPVDFQEYESEEAELADLVADNMLPRLSKLNTTKVQLIVSDLAKIPQFDVKLTGIVGGKLGKITPSGGEAGSTTDSAGAGAPKQDEHVIKLSFRPEAHAEFVALVDAQRKALQIDSMADLLLELLRAASTPA